MMNKKLWLSGQTLSIQIFSTFLTFLSEQLQYLLNFTKNPSTFKIKRDENIL